MYLILSLCGLVFTWYYNLQFIRAGYTLLDFIRAPSMSAATQSLSYDLLITATAGSFWMVSEARRVGIRRVWIYLVLSIVIAFGFAFPLFLFHRETKLREKAIS